MDTGQKNENCVVCSLEDVVEIPKDGKGIIYNNGDEFGMRQQLLRK